MIVSMTLTDVFPLCRVQRLNQSMDVATFVEELKDVLVRERYALVLVYAAWF